MILRDDDINYLTCAHAFKELHQKFIDKKQVHTVAVLMKDLWENHSLFYYLATAPYIEIGLHGWDHKDYSVMSYETCYQDLKKSLDYWKENSDRMIGFHKDIKIFFAPWNRENDNIKKACADLNLQFCNVKKGRWNGQKIRSIHHWSADDFQL